MRAEGWAALVYTLDDVQPFLGDLWLTKLSFQILFLLFSITMHNRHRRDYDEQKAVIVGQLSLPLTRVAN